MLGWRIQPSLSPTARQHSTVTMDVKRLGRCHQISAALNLVHLAAPKPNANTLEIIYIVISTAVTMIIQLSTAYL